MLHPIVHGAQGVNPGETSVCPDLAARWQWDRGHKDEGDPIKESALAASLAPQCQVAKWPDIRAVHVMRGRDRE